ncbi:MAG: cysteine desulfurase [Ruminococcaceae bacterium]|nr:cysteine desulfurase [Oscillospiraceae bacterium]
MPQVYLDNSATTRVCPAAAQKAMELMTDVYGNPSSLHTMGFRAEQEVTAARKAVAGLMGAQPEQITFTSGGTEANNLAVFGAVTAHAREGRHIVTTAVEHASVAAAVDQLEQQGYEVTRLTPDENGLIDAPAIVSACRPDTVLVAVMLVNNETGARFPLEEAVAGIRKTCPKAHVHCDAVQAAGKLPLYAERWGFDSMTVSAHKIHGPKGVGALYLRRGSRLIPRTYGGKQEGGLRPGTEAAPLIAAFGAAVAELPPPHRQMPHYAALRQHLLDRLGDHPGIRFHLPKFGVPYIVHLSVPGYKSETLLHFLAQREIYVSSGSACSKGAQSPVLTALGLPAAEIDSALRVSLCRENTQEDMDRFVDGLFEAMTQLASRKEQRYG